LNHKNGKGEKVNVKNEIELSWRWKTNIEENILLQVLLLLSG